MLPIIFEDIFCDTPVTKKCKATLKLMLAGSMKYVNLSVFSLTSSYVYLILKCDPQKSSIISKLAIVHS